MAIEMVEIPIAADLAHFVQQNDIFAAKDFLLEFQWIEGEGFWLLHLYDVEQKPLALGIKLQPCWPLYVHHQGEPGFILSLQQIVAGASLGRENLNTHFVLVAHVPPV